MGIERIFRVVFKPVFQGVFRDSSAGPAIPTGAIRQRNGAYILDRAGSYIEVRA